MIAWARGSSYRQAARALGISPPTAMRAVHRYQAEGEAGLVDRRSENGPRKVDEDYLEALVEVLAGRASDHGWPRPTWTREMLAISLARRTGTHVSPATLSRALGRIGARRGRPRPVVICPLSDRQRRRRLAAIREVREHLREGDVLLYEDEVDIHLNPKIGSDWRLPGTSREVVTPGRNRKAYLAGALEEASGQLLIVEGARKNARLFLDLLEALRRRYAGARTIHVVLDNYGIHKGRQVQLWLRDRGTHFRLHFLPPYCPNENPIERVWLDLHAGVTRNHVRRSLPWLLHDVRRWIRERNAAARAKNRRAA